MRGEIWHKFAARMTGARNGKLIVALYPEGEEAGHPENKPMGATVWRKTYANLTEKKAPLLERAAGLFRLGET